MEESADPASVLREGEESMQYTAPHYYREFHCTADQCPDTCCAGWQIAIDQKSLKKYRRKKGILGNRLHNEIDWKNESFRQYKGRCAFLNEENLCDLFLEGGSGMFCRTCRLYPRHVEEFEGLREISLSLSCPAAAHLILNCQEPVHFIHQEKRGIRGEEYQDFDFLLFTKLMDAREVIFRILQRRSIHMEVRMAMVLALAHDLQQRIDKEALFEIDSLLQQYEKPGAAEWFHKKTEEAGQKKGERRACVYREAFLVFDGLEVLRDDWRAFLHQSKEIVLAQTHGYEERSHIEPGYKEEGILEISGKAGEYDTVWEQLMIYFVFTYFCGAVYDGNAYVKMKFSLFGTLMIREMSRSAWVRKQGRDSLADVEESARRYAREIEHSDFNKKKLEELLDDEEKFGLETFFLML